VISNRVDNTDYCRQAAGNCGLAARPLPKTQNEMPFRVRSWNASGSLD